MTSLRLSLQSAVFYWRSHVGVMAGSAIAVAVLVGALLVGDSVRFSLRQSALLRLGNIHYALQTSGRFFLDDLAGRLQQQTGASTAPVLLMRGIAIRRVATSEEPRQVNNVQIIGSDSRFQGLSGGTAVTLGDEEIAINARLADEIGARPGDFLSFRLEKPSLLPRDAPLSSRKGDDTIRATFKVVCILQDTQLGRFSLTANPGVPCNVMISLKALQKMVGLEGKANLLLAGGQSSLSIGELDRALKNVWRLGDAGMTWRALPRRGLLQLESDRIMLDPAVGRATAMGNASGSLTYLVTGITANGSGVRHSTPYSFIVAVAPTHHRALGLVPPEMKDDEILVNRWLADGLSVNTGQTVTVSYYQLKSWNRFDETSRVFRVCGIVEMDALKGERELAPRFPGLTDVSRCAEWDIGMPLDAAKIEDKANEEYWNTYRDTPKALVTLKAGQEMWSNRFGNLTAVRFPMTASGREAIEESLRQRLSPIDAGLVFQPVREVTLKAAGEALDFGQLFLGMSLFLIVAALMLTGLLFAFGVQQRSGETGLLLAVGFQPSQVRMLLIRESIWVAGIGAVVGAGLGAGYTRMLIWGLAHSWRDAVASTSIQYHAESMTVLCGAIMGFIMAVASLVISAWRQTSRSARELLADRGAGVESQAGMTSVRPNRVGMIVSCAGLVGAVSLVVLAVTRPSQNPGELFFTAGSLLLVSLLGLGREVLVWLAQAGIRLTETWLGLRNVGRRRARSLTVVGLLACGSFMVFAVSSMQEDVGAGAANRASGTGGFALFGESSLPIQANLGSVDGWTKLGLDRDANLSGVNMVSVKVHDGDDASCLNLNRAQSPRILGVDPNDFKMRGAFCSASGDRDMWDLLNTPLKDGVIPALVGDSNTAQWGLQKKVGIEDGDVLTVRDERGEWFKVKLVGSLPLRLSVFQGAILISGETFAARYPSESGIRMFLADVPAGRERAVKGSLTRLLGKYGAEVVTTVERLKMFYAVETTYMAMFLVLGGMGLLLGSVGMALVVLRTMQDRRAELALLKAVGYSGAQMRRLVMVEHGALLGMGLFVGAASSWIAMWPNLHDTAVCLPVTTLALFLAGITVIQVLCIAVSVRWALRGSLVQALRNQ